MTILFSPLPMLQPKRQSPLFGVYLTLHETVGRTVTVPDVVHLLSKYRRSEVIRWLAAVSTWVAGYDGMDLRNQLAMADQLLTTDLRSHLRDKLQKQPDVRACIFHRRQLLLLVQMTVLVCKESTPECPEEELRQAVGACCLMANDLLKQIEPKESPGATPEEVNDWLASMVIPLADHRDRAEILARAQSFWFDLPATATIQQRIREIGIPDLNTAFTQKYGLPLREYLLIIMSLHTAFSAHADRNKSPLLLDGTQYFQTCFSEDDVRRALATISETPDDLAIKLLSEPRQNWATDSTPLRERPVIQVFAGKYACADCGFLYRCLVDTVYFLLQKAYTHQQFSQLFGYIFHEYINRLISEFTYQGSLLARTFFASPRFQGTSDEVGDGLLFWEDTALLMEYKARMLTTREKYGGDCAARLRGIDDILAKDGKGVNQLAKSLARLLRGERVSVDSANGPDVAACTNIFPAIVVYEGAIALEAVRQQADAKLRSALANLKVDTNRVGPLLLLCTDDVETLEGMAKVYAPKQIILDYVDHFRNNPKDRVGSFRTFVRNRQYVKGVSAGVSFVDSTANRVLEQALAEVEARHAKSVVIEDRGKGT